MKGTVVWSLSCGRRAAGCTLHFTIKRPLSHHLTLKTLGKLVIDGQTLIGVFISDSVPPFLGSRDVYS